MQFCGAARVNKKDGRYQFKRRTELLHFLGLSRGTSLERRWIHLCIVRRSGKKLKELCALLSWSFFQLAGSGRVENRRQRSMEETNCLALKVNYQMELGISPRAGKIVAFRRATADSCVFLCVCLLWRMPSIAQVAHVIARFDVALDCESGYFWALTLCLHHSGENYAETWTVRIIIQQRILLLLWEKKL